MEGSPVFYRMIVVFVMNRVSGKKAGKAALEFFQRGFRNQHGTDEKQSTGKEPITGKRKKLARAASVLACVVAFTTTYALILPAVTLESQPACGQEEHIHTDACYAYLDASGAVVDPAEAASLPVARDFDTDTENADMESRAANPEGTESSVKTETDTAGAVDDAKEAKTSAAQAGSADDVTQDPPASVDGNGSLAGVRTNDTHAGVADAASEAGAAIEANTADAANTESGDVSMADPVADSVDKAVADVSGSENPDTVDSQTADQTEATGSDASSRKHSDTTDNPVTDAIPADNLETATTAPVADTPQPLRRVLICGKEEHRHSVECYPSRSGTSSSDSTKKTSPKSVLTGLVGYDRSQSVTVDGTTITAEYNEGVLPDGVTMQAIPVSADAYVGAVADAVGKENTEIKSFDITFLSGDQEIEPSGEVKITFQADFIDPATDPAIVHITDDGSADLMDTKIANDTITLKTDSFSVYAISYTVDFHYGVDGKTYDFSIPGGGFVSLTDLVEVLGIAGSDGNGSSDVTLDAESAENDSGKDTAEVQEAADADAAVKRSDVAIREAAKKFVAEIESVEFSDPELLSVSKVEEDTTAGAIKDAPGLVCEYSAELTEEQIAEINAQTVEAGDWALISRKAFDTEENLTVTMKDGEQFVVSVTDAQNVTGTSAFDGKTEMVIWTESNGHYYALKSDGKTAEFKMADIDRLGRDYLWTVTFGWDHSDGKRYYIRPAGDSAKSVDLSWDDKDLVSYGSCGNLITAQNGGYVLEGWNKARLLFDSSSKEFIQKMNVAGTPVYFSRQSKVSSFNYAVKSADSSMGLVKAGNGTPAGIVSAQTDTNKKNAAIITAVPNGPVDSNGHSKYIFDYWDLNGNRLNNQTAPTITAGTVDFPYEGYTLTAHFKRNPAYVEENKDFKVGRTFSDEEKAELSRWMRELQSRAIPLDVNGTSKTAEVYDYENRIYRVDMTARSNLETFDGVIDLGFIIDMSGSMQFPANLNEAVVVGSNETTDGWYVRKNVKTTLSSNIYFGDGETKYVSDSEGKVMLHRINDTDETKQILNKNKTYYYVADRSGTFTIYHLKFNTSKNRWESSDASWTTYNDIGWYTRNTCFSNDSSGQYYTLYEASDNGSQSETGSSDNKDTNRKWHLENSLNNTISECNKILKNISIAKGDADNKNPDVEIAYNTFYREVAEKSYTFKSTTGITENLSFDTSGGTGTDLALLSATGEKYAWDYFNGNVDRSSYTERDYTSSGDDPAGFQWNTSDNRYVILITDGAPQAGGKAIADQYVKDAADKLKTEDNVTLITVGLSMSDVKRGSILLYDIASRDDETGEPLFFAAEGDDLQYVLYSIVRSIMQKAIVEGTVTDTVNEAFYPVDKKSGLPLESGNVINLSGEKIADNETGLTHEQKAEGYGVIGLNSDSNYTVTWKGAEISWGGWQGTLYEKAKEDFLGGNAVKTNDPANPARVEATGYKFKAGDTAVELDKSGQKVPETNRVKTLETPRVNVNELSFTMNETDWTVYLGTEVDTKTQLKELLRNILVEETVTVASDTNNDELQDRMTGTSMYYPLREESTSDQRENEGVGKRLTYPLWKLLRNLDNSNKKEKDYIDELISKLIDGNLTYDYELYGTGDSPGKILVSLTKSGETADYNSHVTTRTGTPAETYQLNVLFTPDYTHVPVGQGGTNPYEYHTGTYGTGACGNASADEDSNNKHVVNVFAKKLEIIKTDQSQNTIARDEAVFGLYRKATEAENADAAITKTSLNGLEGNFVLVQTLNTANGAVLTGPLPLLKHTESYDEPYYLVETKAPAGYMMLTEPLRVTIELSENSVLDHNTWTKVPVSTPPETSQTKWDPYVLSNWLQEATIKVTDISGDDSASAIRVIPEEAHGITYDHANDTTDASITYKIINDAGYALPSTGGSGTRRICLFGSILTGFSCVGLVWIRRKKRNTI